MIFRNDGAFIVENYKPNSMDNDSIEFTLPPAPRGLCFDRNDFVKVFPRVSRDTFKLCIKELFESLFHEFINIADKFLRRQFLGGTSKCGFVGDDAG